MRHELTSKTQVGVTCLVLFLSALFLTAYTSRNPSVARAGTSLILDLVTPVSRAAHSFQQGVSSVWARYLFLIHTAQSNAQLNVRVSELEGQLSRLHEFERENERLRSLLHVASASNVQGIAAHVIGGDASGWVKGLLLDRGSSSGVKEGMPVIHPQGVVGQIVSVSSDSSRVLLVNDHASGVDVLHESSRARGVVEGAGEQICELKFVTKDVQVKEGDAVITSGMDTVYPKGILVGHISGIAQSSGALFQTIEVKPAVDLSKVEEVLVVSSGLLEVRPASPTLPQRRGQ